LKEKAAKVPKGLPVKKFLGIYIVKLASPAQFFIKMFFERFSK
jgi:hypothetical protein